MEHAEETGIAWAGLLGGTTLTLFGAAFPAFVFWKTISHWPDLVSGAQAMTSSQALQGILITVVSAQALWFGIRMIARQVAWLRPKRH